MEQETFYHIYNHANGNENLFMTADNYDFFLKRFGHFIIPVADTYAYCLMPNHFHFLIRTKEFTEIQNLQGYKKNLGGYSADDLQGFPSNLGGLTQKYISQQFSNFFNSYSKSFNSVFNRKGALFQPNFKSKPVQTEAYYSKLIHYIHANPVHHGFVNNIEDWPYSSYHTFLSNKKTLLKRDDILEWFNGKDDFIKYHKQPIDPKTDFDFD